MNKWEKLRREAEVCWQLAREMTDPPSAAMFRDRAVELTRRAEEMEARGAAIAKRALASTAATPAHKPLRRRPSRN